MVLGRTVLRRTPTTTTGPRAQVQALFNIALSAVRGKQYHFQQCKCNVCQRRAKKKCTVVRENTLTLTMTPKIQNSFRVQICEIDRAAQGYKSKKLTTRLRLVLPLTLATGPMMSGTAS